MSVAAHRAQKQTALRHGVVLVAILLSACSQPHIELSGGVQLDAVDSVESLQAKLDFPMLVLPEDGPDGYERIETRTMSGPDGSFGAYLGYRKGSKNFMISQAGSSMGAVGTLPSYMTEGLGADAHAVVTATISAAATSPVGILVPILVRSSPGTLLGGSYKTMLMWQEDRIWVIVECKCTAPEAFAAANRLRPLESGQATP